MSISGEYKLSNLRLANIRSWLSTFISLGQRAKDIAAPFVIRPVPVVPLDDIDQVHLLAKSPANLPQPSHPHTPLMKDATATTRPADTPDTLSAAIEIKFLLPVLKYGTEDNGFPNDPRPTLTARDSDKDDYRALIRRTHESVASTIWQHAATAVQQRSVTLHNIEAAGHLERDYWDTHWIVKKANSALPTAAEETIGDQYAWIPIEVCSPKQRWNEHDGLDTVLQSISAVLQALTTHHRVTVNYTCDVHVHVGRADGRHLSLETLKRLATMLWLSEDTIRSIRDPTSPNYENVFTWGAEMTKHSRLAKLTDPKLIHHQLAQLKHSLSDTLILDALRQQIPAISTICNATSHLKLGRLLSGATPQFRRLGFNFSSLGEEDERARNGPKTIEFRVLEGTLDEHIISAWVAICWSFVEVAGEGASGNEGEDGRFIKVIRAFLDDVDMDGCEQDVAQRGYESDDPDCASTFEDTIETNIRQAGLRALVVDGLGVGVEMYDAFVQRLLRGRGM
ncbi:hypothetical protein BR93DRAFT_562096 [Coniochaeta sp. PMI_546]|nr:hypothetical protein BR93DRAFT_562096 [Coniochaeta sp. PMI_546]